MLNNIMREQFIDISAKIINSEYSEGIKCYRNSVICDSKIGKCVTVGDDSTIMRCSIGNNVAINRRSYINDSYIGDFSYSGSNTTINFSKIGRFCSLARNVDIGGFDHDYHKVTTMPMFRFNQLSSGENPVVGSKELCEIGNDVWIAAGTQILHKVKVGDGAVVGGGAVVTKDVPPYAIVVGVPARVIKYRFEDKFIDRLLAIKWWNWPENIILDNINWLIGNDLNDKLIDKMQKICDSLR